MIIAYGAQMVICPVFDLLVGDFTVSVAVEHAVGVFVLGEGDGKVGVAVEQGEEVRLRGAGGFGAREPAC